MELATRYVELAGGPEAALAKARTCATDGDLRFAATLLNHLVFADPRNDPAKEELAGVYERLGHGCENGPWRNFYLMAAVELRQGPGTVELDTSSGMAAALTTEMLLDSVAVRIDGPRAWHDSLTVDLALTDEGDRHRLTLRNGALTHRAAPLSTAPKNPSDLTLTLTKPQLLGLLAGKGMDGVRSEGDPAVLGRLFSYVSEPDKSFAVVTP